MRQKSSKVSPVGGNGTLSPDATQQQSYTGQPNTTGPATTPRTIGGASAAPRNMLAAAVPIKDRAYALYESTPAPANGISFGDFMVSLLRTAMWRDVPADRRGGITYLGVSGFAPTTAQMQWEQALNGWYKESGVIQFGTTYPAWIVSNFTGVIDQPQLDGFVAFFGKRGKLK